MKLVDRIPRLVTASTFPSELVDWLEEVPGVRIHSAGRATWWVLGLPAEVTRDALDDLRVRLRFPSPPATHDAPAISASLTANWRWSDDGGERVLLADVPAALRGSLPLVFADLAASIHTLCDAANHATAKGDREGIDKTKVREALQAPWWSEQTAIELADGWELRPTVGAHPVPVTLRMEGDHLRCLREIASSPRDGPIAAAMCLQSLRWNSQCKQARLCRRDQHFVAEACIHRRLISGELLSIVARAVAVAEHRVRMSFEILREHEEIAAQFAAMFAAPDFPSGPPAAVDLAPLPQKGGS